ncbi:MAG TPA: hypothetical protein VME68_00535 [Acidobacteriaceae bacterium]|nr:hypothetical protein [Acidobacteriaceae bacterium]
MSSVTMEMNGGFTQKIDLSAPSKAMRELIATEAERWRQTEQQTLSARKSLTHQLSSLFRRH